MEKRAELIFQPVKIGTKTAKNRIMMPPLVYFGLDVSGGAVGGVRLEHYEQRARDGVGTIVVEAAAVDRDYIITPCQIGAWDDSNIAELSELAGRVKRHGSLCVIQLQHAGGKPYAPVNANPFGPSAGEYLGHNMREATVWELERVVEQYVESALRMREAGFDGIEIHNAHGYLLTQMASPLLNRRGDEYGGAIERRMKLSLDILRAVREACGADFIIGTRFGANEPTYAEGIEIAKLYEAGGIDYFSASNGYRDETVPESEVPEGFEYNSIAYGGTLVKRAVKNTPVAVVNSIATVERGEWLLKNGYADIIAYGRPLLANGNFIRDYTKSAGSEAICSHCKRCFFTHDSSKCPANSARRAGR